MPFPKYDAILMQEHEEREPDYYLIGANSKYKLQAFIKGAQAFNGELRNITNTDKGQELLNAPERHYWYILR